MCGTHTISAMPMNAETYPLLVPAGYSIEALLLELQMLDSTTRIPGETLTGVEKRYRTQWVGALHYVMQHVSCSSMVDAIYLALSMGLCTPCCTGFERVHSKLHMLYK